MLGRMFGHEFHALLIFQKFLIADDFAALFGFGSRCACGSVSCHDFDQLRYLISRMGESVIEMYRFTLHLFDPVHALDIHLVMTTRV